MTNHDPARRILAAGAMPRRGMTCTNGWLCLGTYEFGYPDEYVWQFEPSDVPNTTRGWATLYGDRLPDLTDGPTIRACWDALFEAIGTVDGYTIAAIPSDKPAFVLNFNYRTASGGWTGAHLRGDTEPEALAAAWEWFAGVRS